MHSTLVVVFVSQIAQDHSHQRAFSDLKICISRYEAISEGVLSFSLGLLVKPREYELLDTGIFDDNRYFDVEIESGTWIWRMS